MVFWSAGGKDASRRISFMTLSNEGQVEGV